MRGSVVLSSALWRNGGSDPDAVWLHRSDGSRDETSSGVWGTFGGEFGACHYNQWGVYGVCVQQCHNAALFPNYFGQTWCFEPHLQFPLEITVAVIPVSLWLHCEFTVQVCNMNSMLIIAIV